MGSAGYDAEHLGWTNTGTRLRLDAAGSKSDGDGDIEDDDPGGDPSNVDLSRPPAILSKMTSIRRFAALISPCSPLRQQQKSLSL
jgi:hypothetical protein